MDRSADRCLSREGTPKASTSSKRPVVAVSRSSCLVGPSACRDLRAGRAPLQLESVAEWHWQHVLRSSRKERVESWKAFFFGSLDPGSFITIDKPPAALWVMELSAWIFGFSSWSILLPEHRRPWPQSWCCTTWCGVGSENRQPCAGVARTALTPVVVVIFRFNDPDVFITLLLVLATCACLACHESGKTVGLVLSGLLVGVAFLTKSLDAFLVVPALGLSYLCCGPARLARRDRPTGLGRRCSGPIQRVVGGCRRTMAEDALSVHRREHQ